MCIPTPAKLSTMSTTTTNNNTDSKPATQAPLHAPVVSKKHSRVQFTNNNSLHQYHHDISPTWYSAQDIMDFRIQARDIILMGNPLNEETRGLERYDIQRSQHKALYSKLLVKASRHGYSAEKVAMAATKLSANSTEIAAAQALKDFFEVHLTIDQQSELSRQQTVTNNKRCIVTNDDSNNTTGRRVRARCA